MDSSEKVVETVTKNTPDHVYLHGIFKSGATVSYSLRGGDQFPNEPAVRWYIYGEKGEIRITNQASGLDIIEADLKIDLHVFGNDVEHVDLPKDDLSNLDHPAQNVGRIYEAYAQGKNESYPDWNQGYKMHELMEEMFTKSGF